MPKVIVFGPPKPTELLRQTFCSGGLWWFLKDPHEIFFGFFSTKEEAEKRMREMYPGRFTADELAAAMVAEAVDFPLPITGGDSGK